MLTKPKKSLGQNFLVDKNIIKLIIKSTKISKEDVLLEIGPGTGNLTESLFQLNPKKIILIEKDFNLVKKLRDRFKKNVEIVNEDILKYKLDNINYQK